MNQENTTLFADFSVGSIVIGSFIIDDIDLFLRLVAGFLGILYYGIVVWESNSVRALRQWLTRRRS